MTTEFDTDAVTPAVASICANTPPATALTAQRAAIVSAGQRLDQALDAFINRAEAVMPDLSVLGACLLMFVLFMGLTGGTPGATDDIAVAQQEAADAATANAPGQPAF